MKCNLLCFFFILLFINIRAQHINVNGEVITLTNQPIQGVIVMAFDHGQLIKSYITDDKGKYRFFVDVSVFDVLFYKPGMRSHTCTISNRLDHETQGINVDIVLNDSLAPTIIDMALWLKKHHLSAGYLDSLYAQKTKLLADAGKHKRPNRKLLQQALDEQKRFSNYTQSTTSDTSSQSGQITTTVIGTDTYELVVSENKGKKYYKNDKPITESTYRFETTRRYDGVLKNSKNVRKFDKYKPLQHVKG